MRLNTITLLLLFIIVQQVYSQDDKTPLLKWSGFVTAETFFDSRQTVATRESDVLIFPKPIEYDLNGKDINAHPSFNILAVHSRLRLASKGVKINNVVLSGLVEFDFGGTANQFVNMIRMRHAFVKLSWQKAELITGQYWHPMFVPECFPAIISWGAGLPVHVLARSPQIRFTMKPSDKFSIAIAAMSQRDFTNSGINNKSSDYLRNSGIPEFQFQLMHKADNLVAGATAGYRVLNPRLINTFGNKVNEQLTSFNANIFLKINAGKVTFRFQQIYAQNADHLSLMGGYADETTNLLLDEHKYHNIAFANTWGDINYSTDKYETGIFVGFAKNMGTTEEVENPFVTYGLGTDIDRFFSVSPRFVYKFGKLKTCFEVNYLSADYGVHDNFLNVKNTRQAEVVRAMLNFIYSF